MAFSVGSLTDYIIENPDLLVNRSLFAGKTIALINSEGNVMTGVKKAEKINILATDAIFQSGDGCSRTSSGTTSVTQREVSVGAIAVVEDLCAKTLRSKYLSKKLQAGSRELDIPFEKEVIDLKLGVISEQLEVAMWQGNTSHGDVNLSKFDGFVKLIDAASGVTQANATAYISGGAIASATGITTSNVVSVVNAMWLALPAKVQGKSDVRVFCGWDVFQKFVAANVTQNLFAYAPKGSEVSADNGEIIIPGTNYKLTAVHGLDGTNRLFAMRTSNMFAGTDLLNEEERLEVIPDQFKDYARFVAEFKYGVNVAFPDEIVKFTLS